MLTSLAPEIDSINKPYWDGLEQGKLLYQSCACGHRWLPARALCPNCLTSSWGWKQAHGRGKIISWVVYHTAHHDSLKDKLPYNVALVELEEGPRLLTNILPGDAALKVEGTVRLDIDPAAAVKLPLFRIEETE